MHVLRQLDVHPKVREEADILVRTFSGAIGKYDRPRLRSRRRLMLWLVPGEDLEDSPLKD